MMPRGWIDGSIFSQLDETITFKINDKNAATFLKLRLAIDVDIGFHKISIILYMYM